MTYEFVSEAFMSLITADLYAVIAAVYGICFALKRAKFFDDRFIPLAALVSGVGIELLYFAGTGGAAVDFILRGIISGMASVYAANIIKQLGGNVK